jgi:HNH endonuclease
MGFPSDVKEQVLLACGRHCCLCHKFCGLKIELHHIIQASEGGLDTFENCIPLCFDCHGDMRSYDHKHPKGTKYTPSELKRHRDKWYAKAAGAVSLAGAEATATEDRKVFAWLVLALPYEGVVSLLERKDFGAPFQLQSLDALDRFLHEAQSPHNEFLDSDLEALRAELISRVRSFDLYLSLNTFPMSNPAFQAVPREWEDQQPKRFVETIDKLNELSKQAAIAYHALVRESRRRLASVA